MKRLDKARDLFIVADIVKDSIFIRRSEKQWRKQLYRVKPAQIIKVVATLVPSQEEEQNIRASQEGKEMTNKDKSAVTKPSPGASKAKARLSIQQGYRHKMTAIQ